MGMNIWNNYAINLIGLLHEVNHNYPTNYKTIYNITPHA